jgi:hypothetical protein
MLAQNKCGMKERVERNDIITLRTIIYRSTDIYNRIPKELTLINNHYKFKKCISKYSINPKTIFRISNQEDFKETSNYSYEHEPGDQCLKLF